MMESVTVSLNTLLQDEFARIKYATTTKMYPKRATTVWRSMLFIYLKARKLKSARTIKQVMGIPFFAKTITRKYPGIIINRLPTRCARLYLDLNCAIHQCAQKLMTSFRCKASFENALIASTIDYIKKIAAFSPPSELLYIAVDGIPPRAKMVQQRKRRFMSNWRKDVLQQRAGVRTPWDTNAITPGTTFMNELASRLHGAFARSNVIVSDSNQPGEGEAKIMAHIKATRASGEGCDVVYGLDADLIMLALSTRNREICLLREPAQYEIKTCNVPFLYFDIRRLYDCIGKEHGENRVMDYVVLCFLLGNDFLPPLGYLKIRNGGIDRVLAAYKTATQGTDDTLIESNGINYALLVKVLESLKEDEDTQMVLAEKAYFGQRPARPMGTSLAARIGMEIDNYPTLHKAKSVEPERDGWRMNYYHSLFGTTELVDVNEACRNYLEGIEWTFQYYFGECVSREWHYKHEYSPTILDLYNYLLTLMDEDVKVTLQNGIVDRFPDHAYTQDLQLLMVLPPSSADLIRPCLRDVMTDVSHGCVHMYPRAFKIGTYLKTYLWECHPDLPPVEVERLRAFVKVTTTI